MFPSAVSIAYLTPSLVVHGALVLGFSIPSCGSSLLGLGFCDNLECVGLIPHTDGAMADVVDLVAEEVGTEEGLNGDTTCGSEEVPRQGVPIVQEEGSSLDNGDIQRDRQHNDLRYGEVMILQKEGQGMSPLSSADEGSKEATATGGRTYVFDRLSHKRAIVDERLLFGVGERNKLDFAATVGSKDTTTLQFFPLEDKVQSRIHIPVTLAKEAAKTYHTTLYGYFFGPRLHFPVVQSFVKAAWGEPKPKEPKEEIKTGIEEATWGSSSISKEDMAPHASHATTAVYRPLGARDASWSWIKGIDQSFGGGWEGC
ncbi:hypothetical protein L6452_18672 [Arctium lappa]|uniref:Uncharacterized protein n=1 Tax=Arctium lappa TaxID=4217 RepID=A0ACB9C6U3_ARCLA|nr:hypothetical protein L6452_18672 [Arctium lappa]